LIGEFMDDLSMLQRRVLVFIKAFLNNYGYPPTVREIAKGTDIKSTSTVHDALNKLEQKGYINRDGGQSRSTVIMGVSVEKGVYSIPLMTRKGEECGFGMIDVPKSLIQDREGIFAVKSENAFYEKGVLEGDVLIVKSCKEADKDDLVVYDDLTVGTPCFSEFGNELDELASIDGIEEYEEEKSSEIIGKVLVCIRHF